MCGSRSAPKPRPLPKPEPIPEPPPIQPPSIEQSSAEVKIGSRQEEGRKRKRITRSSLRQSPSASAGGTASSGLGS